MEKLQDMSPENKKTFVQNKAYKDLIEGAKNEYDQVMSNPEEQIAFWKNEMEFAEGKLDEIINNHECTLSKHEACAVCEALVDAGLTTYSDRYADLEADRQDLAYEASKEDELPF